MGCTSERPHSILVRRIVAFGGWLTIHRLGGHFQGGAVLHWANGNASKGVLFSGDIIQVVADRQWVRFMYSYPNLIPFPSSKVSEMTDKISKFEFGRLYSGFHRVIETDAKESVLKSAQRYIDAVEGRLFTT